MYTDSTNTLAVFPSVCARPVGQSQVMRFKYDTWILTKLRSGNSSKLEQFKIQTHKLKNIWLQRTTSTSSSVKEKPTNVRIYRGHAKVISIGKI